MILKSVPQTFINKLIRSISSLVKVRIEWLQPRFFTFKPLHVRSSDRTHNSVKTMLSGKVQKRGYSHSIRTLTSLELERIILLIKV